MTEGRWFSSVPARQTISSFIRWVTLPDCSICCVSDTQQNVKSASKFLFLPSGHLAGTTLRMCYCHTLQSAAPPCRSRAVGFEPTNMGAKTPCLTSWLCPCVGSPSKVCRIIISAPCGCLCSVSVTASLHPTVNCSLPC